jgi:hypothetical protein
MRGSADPAEIIMAARRTAPKHFRSIDQQSGQRAATTARQYPMSCSKGDSELTN